MNNKLIILIIVAALCTSCGNDAAGETSDTEVSTSAVDTIPMLVTQIQKCSRLYTTEYHIHKIVTHKDVLRLKGNLLSKDIDIPLPLGERQIAIPMDATLKAYIDFSLFTDKNIERHGRKITILLPDPQVLLTSSKINRKEIREYVGLTRSRFTDKELASYEQQGRQVIVNSIPRLAIKEQAQQNAARVLVPMLTQMGYREEDIIIAFRRNLNMMDIINSSLEKGKVKSEK
jgi:hypothetical protein